MRARTNLSGRLIFGNPVNTVFPERAHNQKRALQNQRVRSKPNCSGKNVDDFKGSEGLTHPEIDAIKSGSLLVVMYGTLKYDDVFGTPRVTDYCVVYTPDTNGFSSCNKYNRAN